MEFDVTASQRSGKSNAAGIYSSIDLSKSFWILTLGSLLGFVIETVWCFFVHEHLEWHSSLIFMPFTAVYGCGSLILYLGSYFINREKKVHIFIFGAASCSVAEYLFSLMQEEIFGTVSWDYSKAAFNIEGRVCLPLTLIWGILGIMWITIIQPIFEKLISLIPGCIYKQLTLFVLAALIISGIISAAAVSRWTARLNGVPSTGVITDLLDATLTNDFMRACYPKMRFDT